MDGAAQNAAMLCGKALNVVVKDSENSFLRKSKEFHGQQTFSSVFAPSSEAAITLEEKHQTV